MGQDPVFEYRVEGAIRLYLSKSRWLKVILVVELFLSRPEGQVQIFRILNKRLRQCSHQQACNLRPFELAVEYWWSQRMAVVGRYFPGRFVCLIQFEWIVGVADI